MLPEIIAHKRRQVAAVDRTAVSAMREQIASLPPVRSLKASLTAQSSLALIAEIKRRSPSRGNLADVIDVPAVAQVYESAGASAISVLTDEKYFSGTVDDLQGARAPVQLPVLRKDFIVDSYQVYESRVIGADAILLIVAALSFEELTQLHAVARQAGLEVLVEVHNKQELETALQIEPEIVGVNNRDLKTFTVNLEVCERLRQYIPNGVVTISESGIQSHADMKRIEMAGYDAVLIGEGIITAADHRARIHELLGKTS